jgi:hypothetical protein
MSCYSISCQTCLVVSQRTRGLSDRILPGVGFQVVDVLPRCRSESSPSVVRRPRRGLESRSVSPAASAAASNIWADLTPNVPLVRAVVVVRLVT